MDFESVYNFSHPGLKARSFDYLYNFDYSRKYDVWYYLNDFWNDVADPDINGKPLMSGGPLGWITFLILVVYWIRIVGPDSMRGKEAADMKAWLLCLNGLTFGSYATGLLAGLYYSDFGLQSFSCDSCHLSDRSIAMYIRKSTGYVFLGAKVWEFLRPVFAVYRKRDNEITNWYLLHCFASTVFLWVGLKLYPGGIFTFLPYIDSLYQIFAYAYLIMTCASDEMKPSESYRRFLYRMKMTSAVLVLLHAAYFLTKPNCGPTFLKVIQLVYAAIGLIVGPGEFRLMEQMRKERLIRLSERKKIA